MKKKTLVVVVTLFSMFGMITTLESQNPADKVERIPEMEALLEQMTLEEKVGQMAQLTLDALTVGDSPFESDEPITMDKELLRRALVEYNLGSVLNTANNRARTPETWHYIVSTIQDIAVNESRLGIPVIYGVDAIHGTTYTDGATMFPQQIGMAATWNPELVRRAGEITAYETRASSIPWNFSPVLDMGRDPRFPRMWETFGEDMYLASVLGVELTLGYEGENNDVSNPYSVASCLKHFIGYGTPVSGKDRTPANMPEIELRERHLPPFEAAIENGAHSVMLNSGINNGVPVHISYELITEMLKGELEFTGLVITDWADIDHLHTRDRVAETPKEAVKMAINAGIDMAMIPYSLDFCDHLIELVNEGKVSEERIDDAVRRILNLKYKLGLFDTPVTHYSDYPDFGSDQHRDAAYKTAQESITLLKNKDDILPLSRESRVLVAGPNSNSMRPLNGGWTYSWQGELVDEFASDYATIADAVKEVVGADNVVVKKGVRYDNDANYWVDEAYDIEAAVKAAAEVDYVILAVGENSYTEKPGDLHDLALSQNQQDLAKALAETGTPVILVLNQGRPRLIREIEPMMAGVINSYLPGNFGGKAIADVIFGKINPSGKLPFTYPLYANSLITYDHKPSEHQERMAGMYDYESDFAIQYPFGFGLSYTEFDYSNLNLSSTTLKSDEQLEVSVEVTNIGEREGMEVVQLYSSDLYASITPDVMRLRRFEKINLKPGETKKVTFVLSPGDFSFINANNERVTEPGDFEIHVGELTQGFVFVE
ncbi:glycoside hydrolase family 3 N-terminal domain-containing protein [Marinilabiliaceae bacterium ANBcel2]|nr:glycoside hydrolase family 3 N-terminal domain-containing protein [Marinilabiliaceae bacterium ANBcel2]